MKAIRIILLMTMILLASACSQTLTLDDLTVVDADKDAANGRGPVVVLKVEGNPPKLVFVTNNDPDCKGRGCLVSKRKQLVLARFELTDSPGWAFSRFEICQGIDKTARECDLSVWSRLEFGVGTDLDKEMISPDLSGLVELRKVSENKSVKEFRVANLNSLRANYFYRVQACPVTESGTEYDSGACIWDDDPLWRNRGRK